MVGITLVAAFVLAALTRADDDAEKPKKKADADSAVGRLIDLGPGVHKVKTDGKGRIQSCIIIGQSRISTTLGKAKGLEVARQRARLAASAEFVKWLKEKVDVREKSEDETILFLEGGQENDKDALRESGKSVEKTTKKIESTAMGLARGFQVLASDVNDEDKTYTLVIGWSAKMSEATKKVRRDLADDQDKSDEGGKGKGKNKRVISDDIDQFIK
jgi:hypothetical protein